MLTTKHPSLSQTTSNGELSEHFYIKCPCFQVVEIRAQNVSNSARPRQRFTCNVCSHPFHISFTHNELGACHFFNKSYDLACSNYQQGFQDGETTGDEYLYNMHEALDCWASVQGKSQQMLTHPEATRRLDEVMQQVEKEEETQLERPPFWFENAQVVLEMKEEKELHAAHIAEKIAIATEESGLTKEQALKKIRALLKRLRKIEGLKSEMDLSGSGLDSLKEEQRVMLQGEEDIRTQLQQLDDLFMDFL